MHVFSTYVLTVLSLHAFCTNAFNLFDRRHVPAIFHKRSTRPRQCVLVRPSPGFSAPATLEGNGDQSPLLPGPSTGRAKPNGKPSGKPGTIQAQSACGDIGATETVSPLAGPNGAISWMTCGINSTGWTPSYAAVSDIITADLPSALRQGNSPFEACHDYLDIIETYAAKYKLPSILVASFAMQESGCRPDVQGQGGEQGLMQISEDKCNGAPDGDCKDPDFNVHQGTKFLAQTLATNNGNILVTIGQYNGWYEGMTYADATAPAQTSCCHCQQNLDYLFQVLNGWILNRNPLVSPRLGDYFNLDVCG